MLNSENARRDFPAGGGNHAYCGYTNATLGLGWTALQFGGLLEDETFNRLDKEHIDRVNFFVCDANSNYILYSKKRI